MHGQCMSSFWAGQPWFPNPSTVPTAFYWCRREKASFRDEVDPIPPHLVSSLHWLVAEKEAGLVFAHQASSVGALAMWISPIYWWNPEATSLMDGNALWAECWPSSLFTSRGDCAGVSLPCCYPAGNKMNGRARCASQHTFWHLWCLNFHQGFTQAVLWRLQVWS